MLKNNEESKLLMKEGKKSVVLGKLYEKNLEKRYPKLIYAYKKFFINLNKLVKNSEFYNECARNDIYVIEQKHSLENYDKILREVRIDY